MYILKGISQQINIWGCARTWRFAVGLDGVITHAIIVHVKRIVERYGTLDLEQSKFHFFFVGEYIYLENDELHIFNIWSYLFININNVVVRLELRGSDWHYNDFWT